MTMTLVKLSYNSKLVPDPGLVLQTPLCKGQLILKCPFGFFKSTKTPTKFLF